MGFMWMAVEQPGDWGSTCTIDVLPLHPTLLLLFMQLFLRNT